MALKEFLSEYGQSVKALPRETNTYKGRKVIVCGDAACVWDDLEAFGARSDAGPRGSVLKDGWDIMTVNKLIEVMPAHVDHIYSNEPSLLHKFVAARRCEYGREFANDWLSHSCNVGADVLWPWGGHATSGLGAALVGIGLGYDEIVLCGIPLEDGPHNGEPPWRRTAFTREAAGSVETGENSHWKAARKLAFEGRVTSMSGRTRKWLGAPLERSSKESAHDSPSKDAIDRGHTEHVRGLEGPLSVPVRPRQVG
jgi:hypothetical protein